MARRLLDINPLLDLTALDEFLDPESAARLVQGGALAPRAPLGVPITQREGESRDCLGGEQEDVTPSGCDSPQRFDYVVDCIGAWPVGVWVFGSWGSTFDLDQP